MMEKEPQPESMATVAIKPDYPPSEYSSEPPPAYQKPRSASVQIAKIVAVTVVVTAVILGGFMLASAYVSATASCRQLEQELELLGEAADRLQPAPQADALVQDDSTPLKRHADLLNAEEPKHETKDIDTNSIDNDSDSSSENSDNSDSNSDGTNSSDSDSEEDPIHLHLPVQLDLEQLAQALVEKHQKTKMNCIVEKKKAEEVVDHKPKTIKLPFGVNVTTDPRYEKISGERMVIICESGSLQRTQPPPSPPPSQQPQDDDDDSEEETIMIQPVMIPIPQTHFQTHMPQQMAPQMDQPPMRPLMRFPVRPPMNSMEAMRPPMPPMMQIQIQQQIPQEQQQPQSSNVSPNSIVHYIVQQIIAQKIMEAKRAREEQFRQQQQPQIHEIEVPRGPHRFQPPPSMIAQRIPISEDVITQLNRLPNRDVIVAVSSESDESDENSQESRSNEDNSLPQEVHPIPQDLRPIQQIIRSMPHFSPEMRPIPQEMRPMRDEMRPMREEMRPMREEMRPMRDEMRPISQEMRPVPTEIRPVSQELRPLSQEVNQVPQQIRLIPHEIRVVPHEVRVLPQEIQTSLERNDQTENTPHIQMHVVAQQQQEANEDHNVHPQVEMRVVPQEMHFVQEQRTTAAEMNGRQGYGRAIPVDIPVSMMPHEQEQEPQAAASEQSRPHYVQPRSLRAVEA